MPGDIFPSPGVNIIGHVSGNLGLGVLARHTVSVLLSRGCPVQILDVDPKFGRTGHDLRFAEFTVGSVRELVHPVTLLIFPPISIIAFLKDPANRDLLFRRHGLNAALMNWEQMVVPATWKPILGGLDAIVAPSAFTRETFEQALPDVPVLVTRVPFQMPDTMVTPNRARFGLQPNRVWFGSSFEPHSDFERKNPFAVLDAFERAFPSRGDVGLGIKVNNPTADDQQSILMRELRTRCQGDRRIRLFEQSLNYESVLSLYASLDVYVSLHRAEGIGLGLMEAMSLGKPVIATGWSGNMSFMDRTNSCPVTYSLVPVRGRTYVYSAEVLGPRAVWANPDVVNAADWMRLLVERPDIRAAIGSNARESMGRYQEDARRAVFLDELRLILDSEVSWGIGELRRKARRDRLARAIGEEAPPERTRFGSAWMRRALSLARNAGFRRRSPYWSPPPRSRP